MFNFFKSSSTPPPTPTITSDSSDQQSPPPYSVDSIVKEGNLSLLVSKEKNRVLLKVIPPQIQTRTFVDICAVIDTSASMYEEANLEYAEKTGLCILDVVKHAMHTIISTLSENDRLSIITFSSNASLKLELTVMDSTGRDQAKQIVSNLYTETSTNLWSGISLAINEFIKNGSNNRFGSIFVLTDGVPNIIPPRGHLTMLKEYKDKFPGSFPVINTFGFGYNMDSKLLTDISIIGNGQFSFIPDSSFVGTIFINSLTSLYTTFARNVVMSIIGPKHAIVPGGFNYSEEDWGIRIEMCCILDTCRDIILITLDSITNVTISYESRDDFTDKKTIESNGKTSVCDSVDLDYQNYRLDTAELCKQIYDRSSGEKIGHGIDKLVHNLQSQLETFIHLTNEPRAKELYLDIKGQLSEAIQPDYYKKWGRHYLLSLGRTHLLKICNNFKDPGIQLYISNFGKKLRLEFDNLFLSLDPPAPSFLTSTPVQISVFHNSSNPCFSGESLITLSNGSEIRVDEATRGMRIKCGNSEEFATIRCVVETKCPSGFADLVQLNPQIAVTPYHPIVDNNRWKFPIDIKKSSLIVCNAVYSFVLESADPLYFPTKIEDNIIKNTIIVGGHRCATLGHQIRFGDIISHEFFGTRAVIDDLKMNFTEGWKIGKVVVSGTKKNFFTGKVYNFLPVVDIDTDIEYV